MLFFRVGGEVDASYQQSLSRLKHLVADMEMIAAGRHPADLAAPDETPTLSNWSTVAAEVTALMGQTSSHPVLTGDDRRIVTSPVCLVSNDLKWSRTMSRWYRLMRNTA